MRLVGQEKERKSDTRRPGGPPPAPTRPGAEKGTWLPKMPPGRTWLWLVLVLAVNFWLARMLMPGPEAPATVPYTLFKEEVAKGNVQAIYSRGDTLTGRFKTAVTYPPAGQTTAAPKGQPAAASGGVAARSPEAGDLLRDHASVLCGARSRSVPDRTRGRDQRQADRGGQ